MTKAIDDWLKAVKIAKKRLAIPVDSYKFVQGPLLKEAQKVYCAMGY
jgi:hypothetical protein